MADSVLKGGGQWWVSFVGLYLQMATSNFLGSLNACTYCFMGKHHGEGLLKMGIKVALKRIGDHTQSKPVKTGGLEVTLLGRIQLLAIKKMGKLFATHLS